MLKKFVVTLSIVSLVGCSAIEVDYDEEKQKAQKMVDDARMHGQKKDESEFSNIRYEKEFYVPQLNDKDKQRPSWFFEETAFSYRATPFRMVVSDLFGEYASVRYLQNIEIDKPVTLNHEGELGSALEKLALSTGYTFTVDDGVMSWYKYRHEEFDVSFIPGLMDYTMGEPEVGSSQQQAASAGFQVVKSGNSASSNGGSISFSGQSKVAEEFVKGVNILLSKEGEFSINESTSTLIVRDIPENVRDISAYVEKQNDALAKQVAIKIQVIDVTFTENNQTSLDLNLVKQSTDSSIATTLASGVLPEGSQLLRGTLGFTKTSGQWAGSQAFIDALKEQGIVSIVTEPEIVTMNNQIGQVKVEDVQGYLASVGSNQIANSGTSEQLIPGEVTTGFKFSVLPHIKGDKVLMQLDAVMSELQGLEPQSDGSRTITVPNYNTKQFFLRNWVKNQETLMISGLRNVKRDVRNDKGILSSLFGGRKGENTRQTETIILITPFILDGTGA